MNSRTIPQDRASKYIGPWVEITEEEYTEKLNCLPPEKWRTVLGVNIFRMCEYLTENVTDHYARLNGRFFEAGRRTSTPYEEIAAEVAKFEFETREAKKWEDDFLVSCNDLMIADKIKVRKSSPEYIKMVNDRFEKWNCHTEILIVLALRQGTDFQIETARSLMVQQRQAAYATPEIIEKREHLRQILIAKPFPWLHASASDLWELKGAESIEVFDDEEPDFLHLYLSAGGKRYPARSIDCSNTEHRNSVLRAWSRKRGLIDSRTDKSNPLLPS
jgi:hypothetical protein